jgi:hypothetical protein
MALYIISYDLIGKSYDQYETLIAELHRIGAKRVLLSQWAFRSNNTSEEIRDHLFPFMHANDRLLVTEITQNWASRGALIDLNSM